MYVIVWEFAPRAGREAEFEGAYGPAGAWTKFFRRGDGYLGTELWRGGGRYLTVDRWISREAYDAFRAAHLTEYESLDRSMEALTARETRVGDFTSI